MSAIGSGVTLICGNQLDGFAGSPTPAGIAPSMFPVTLAQSDVLTLSHFVGRKAWQVIITDDNGNVIPAANIAVAQTLQARPLPDLLTVTKSSVGAQNVFVAIRWQENSVEAQLFPVGQLGSEGTRTATSGNATVTITPAPPG